MKDFHDLHVWERSHRRTLAIYAATLKFPREELYGLTRGHLINSFLMRMRMHASWTRPRNVRLPCQGVQTVSRCCERESATMWMLTIAVFG
jgi:hypothetical protein